MDPFSAAVKLFEFIIKGLELSRQRNKDFFKEVIQPAYDQFQEIHVSYVNMFRILDDVKEDNRGIPRVNLEVRNRFVTARRESDTKRDIFRTQIGKVVATIEDSDNRTFFGMIFLYFIYDEDLGAFLDKRWVDRDIEELRSKIASRDPRADGERKYETPSAKAAIEIAKLDDPDAIRDLARQYINNLNRRMHSITERFVEIRHRYFPS